MAYQRVLCLPDLLRGTRAFPDGFFDLVREPVRQGCGMDIGRVPGGKLPHGLIPGFDVELFRGFAGAFSRDVQQQAQWSATHHTLPMQAVDYLFEHFPPDSLLLTFEIPPWLARACDERGVSFLDLRVSPLRFGRDLYMALRSSDDELSRRVGSCTVSEEELRLEAALLGANVRMHQARLEEAGRYLFDDLDGCLVFVGQAPFDASLVAADGHALRCEDFAERIARASQGRRLLHKGHPFAPEFVEEERAALSRITGQVVTSCSQNAYQVLSVHADVALVGISSGMLQEAAWFQKAACTLHQPVVPLAFPGSLPTCEQYQQVHFHTFLAPGFWHRVLTPDGPVPKVPALPSVAHHHARETFDQWWDYSKVLTWERSLPHEAFARSGGWSLGQRLQSLEAAVTATSLLGTGSG